DAWHACIYVYALAEEICQLMPKPRLCHRVFNSGGHTVQAADLASMVQQVIPEARISFSADRPRSPFIYQMDDSRIVRELGFQRRSMIEGIRNHVSYVRKFSHAGKLCVLPSDLTPTAPDLNQINCRDPFSVCGC